MGKKKSFVDRKNATTFRLMHRSQKDPLIADNTAGEHVLHPVAKKKDIEERQKYGVYFDDDYDYLKHLKDRNEVVSTDGVERTVITVPKSAVQLPSTIFETKGIELKVGLLNQAAPRNELLPDVDPDIAAALDGDADFDDESDLLEDDFIQQANASGSDGEDTEMTEQPKEDGRTEMLRRFGLVREQRSESDEEDDDDDDEEDEDHEAVHPEDAVSEEDDRKSRFTNYSMTSSVIKRPDGLKMIDDHFETLYEEYDEEKIGECDVVEEELGGYIEPDSDRFLELVQEFQSARGLKVNLEKPDDEVKRLALDAYRKEQERGEQMEVISVDMPGAKRAKWDCESVLSTYTNIYNHPTLIREEPKRKGVTKKDLKELEKMDDSMSVISGFSVSTVRPRGETAEERRTRKAAIKEERRERRVEKKSNKEAFKQEKKQMDSLRSQPKIPARPIK